MIIHFINALTSPIFIIFQLFPTAPPSNNQQLIVGSIEVEVEVEVDELLQSPAELAQDDLTRGQVDPDSPKRHGQQRLNGYFVIGYNYVL